ncbi:Gfo/Idh/MocA family protein [Hephaestia sp. GCM10023244]|uniref:Gfo/Idh/MocA family protein n=1 Tax=unclassified Hephaestia TaxID=2631281 RepID=UPI00207749C1|nr:Gfo/Idh/MocA family oxidoreductase [Hephaestia sp. MAHUQ-44]MCM8730910.1 Gfo/Idh/MocA family oxidoreductase [Hephaestia sp. MAHUQ-44]
MSSTPIPIAIIGIGKIARDQHMPTIAADPNFRLAAFVTRRDQPDDVPRFATITEMAKAMPEVKAIAICTPPRGRLELVREAIAAGLDIMLEKPPAATIGEAQALADLAAASDVVLHATWHSREAAAVEPAMAWLADRTIHKVSIAWKEDVRVWHPGQEWIWESGIGVFDPGINALSVLTKLLGSAVLLETAALRFPSNRDAPIAADLTLAAGPIPIEVAFDFDQRGPQTWDIVIETDRGTLTLSAGASKMAVDGTAVAVADDPEYARLYRRFHHLVTTRTSDVDFSPFRLVADAFMLGKRETVGAFDWR